MMIPGHGGQEPDPAGLKIPVMILFLDGHVAGPFRFADDFDNNTILEFPKTFDDQFNDDFGNRLCLYLVMAETRMAERRLFKLNSSRL